MISTKISLILVLSLCVLVQSLPFHKNSDEIIMQVQRVNEEAGLAHRGIRKSKVRSAKNNPIYYVPSRINGKFGKSIRAFNSNDFEKYLGFMGV